MHVIERAGGGIPVLCIHGFCQSAAYWAPMLDRLAARGRAGLAADLPGFGASAGLPGPYTMEAFADALVHLLDARGIARVALVGGSMGGVVAQHLVLRHPDRVARLLLVATGAFAGDPAAGIARSELLTTAPWDDALARLITGGFFHREMPAPCMEEARRIALVAARPAAVEAARANALSNTFEGLAQISVPVQIIQGRHDAARTPEHGAVMLARLRGGRLNVLEGSGHTPQLEEPDAFDPIALPFLEGA
jgi:pimeloyl-ACP methyl ester carboxylesterase